MNYRKLLSDRAAAARAHAALLSAPDASTWILDPAHPKNQEASALQAKIADLDAQIAEADVQRDAERNAPSMGEPFDRIGDRAPAAGGQASTWRAGSPRTYAAAFGGSLSTGGFANLDEFIRTIDAGVSDPRVMAAMGEAVGSEGGFAVPSGFTAQLLDAALEDEIVRPRAQFVPLTGETTKAPVFDGQDHSGGALFGGLTPTWMAEAESATDQDVQLALLTLTAHKLGIWARTSNELVADGRTFEDQLGVAMVRGIAWGLDYAFLNGNGVGKPRGVLNDPALIVVAKETGQAADSILYENLVKMFARIAPASVRNSVWIANNSTIPQLLTLVQVVGTGGTPVPVLREDGRGGYTILTRPVIFTEKVPAVGDQGDIILADLSQYAVGLRQDAILQKSIHVGWQTDQTGYRTILRADGQGSWVSALTPRNGDSLSWAVTLAARA